MTRWEIRMPLQQLSSVIDDYPGIISNTCREWENVKHLGQTRSLKKNTIFSFDGEASQDFAYVLQGSISIAFFECNGQAKIQLICNPGSLFNEVNIITGYHKNKVYYMASCDSKIIYFEKNKINSVILPQYPELLKSITYSLAVKVMKFQSLFNAVCTRNKRQLICWYILSMSQCHNNATDFVPGISQEQIRSLLGLKKTSMKRCMAWLKNENIVPLFTKRRLIIADYERLADLAMPSE